VADTLQNLELVNMERQARVGYLGYKAAQQRMRERVQQEEQTTEKNIERILEDTARYDSPLHAAKLQFILRKNWSEERSAYVVMSKLTEKQRSKINSMIANRYN